MRKAVTHGIHHLPRDMRVSACESWVYTLNVVSRFTNYFNIADDGILNQFTGMKTNNVHIGCMPLNPLNGREDVL